MYVVLCCVCVWTSRGYERRESENHITLHLHSKIHINFYRWCSFWRYKMVFKDVNLHFTEKREKKTTFTQWICVLYTQYFYTVWERKKTYATWKWLKRSHRCLCCCSHSLSLSLAMRWVGSVFSLVHLHFYLYICIYFVKERFVLSVCECMRMFFSSFYKLHPQ